MKPQNSNLSNSCLDNSGTYHWEQVAPNHSLGSTENRDPKLKVENNLGDIECKFVIFFCVFLKEIPCRDMDRLDHDAILE